MKRLPTPLLALLCFSFLVSPLPSATASPVIPAVASTGSPGNPAAAAVVLSDKALVNTKDYEDTVGPEAFAVSGSRVYIENSLNGTIRSYASGKYVGALKLAGVATIDLQASGNTLTVLDNANTIRTYTVNSATKATLTGKQTLTPGTMSTGTLTVSAAEAKATGLAAQSTQNLNIRVTADRINSIFGGLAAKLNNGTQAQVSGAALTASAVSGASAEHFAKVPGGFNVLTASGVVAKKIRLRYTPETIEALYRGGGYDYYYVCDSYSDTSGAGVFNTYVFKFATDGTPAGVYTLKNSTSYAPNREVQVADGQVYQLLVDGGKAQVLRLAPDTGASVPAKNFAVLTTYSTSAASTASVAPQASKPKKPKKPKKVSLRAVMLNNWAYTVVGWKYSKTKNGNVPKGYASKVKDPWYIAQLKATKETTATFAGLPYTWGGWDTMRTSSSTSWKNFAAGLKKGKYAGNVSSKNGNRQVPGTIGVDCSGMVSAAFTLPEKHGTSSLRGTKYFEAIKKFSPKPGDILVHKGHHVMIYYGKTEDGQWLVGESINNLKHSDKVVYWTRDPASFKNKGYKVGHYRNLVG